MQFQLKTQKLAPDETKFFHCTAVQVMAGRDQTNFKMDNTGQMHE
jgi:hypothetical protein